MRGNEIPYNCRIWIIEVSLNETPLVHCMAEVPVVMSVCLYACCMCEFSCTVL